MSDTPLFKEVGDIMDNAQDLVDMEKMSKGLLNISFSLVALRGYLLNAGFSEQWIEEACMVLWRKWFPTTEAQ